MRFTRTSVSADFICYRARGGREFLAADWTVLSATVGLPLMPPRTVIIGSTRREPLTRSVPRRSLCFSCAGRGPRTTLGRGFSSTRATSGERVDLRADFMAPFAFLRFFYLIEKEKEREKEADRQTETETERVNCVCVCVYI